MKAISLIVEIPSQDFDDEHDFEIEDEPSELQKHYEDENKLRSFRTRKLLSNLSDFEDQQSPMLVPRGEYLSPRSLNAEIYRSVIRKESGNALDLEFDNNVHRAIRLQYRNEQRVSADILESKPDLRRGSGRYRGVVVLEFVEEVFITEIENSSGSSLSSAEDDQEEVAHQNTKPSSPYKRRPFKGMASTSIPASGWKRMLAKAKQQKS